MSRPRIARVLWGAVGLVVGLLVVKFFVADVYRIQSGSMRPTIFGGAAPDGGNGLTEWVLVRYGRTALSRFDLVVVRGREAGDPVVKRVVALPGETVQIVGGDLLIDGRRLGPDVPRPNPIPVFDDRHQVVEEFFHFKSDGPWRRDGDAWVLDASGIPHLSSKGLMFYNPDLRDDYLGPDGERVGGLRQANDGVLECEFALDETDGATLRFLLVEEGDTFEVELAPDPEGPASHVLSLLHRDVRSSREAHPNTHEQLFGAAAVEIEPGRWVRLRFANIDDHVEVELPELGVILRHRYAGNEPFPKATTAGDKSRGPRVGFGGEGGRARFRSIRILRDLFYTSVGEHAVGSPLALDLDEVFLLGDSSAESRDSRFFGPVRLSSLVGRPVAVVWPRSRWRRLTGAQAP